MSIWSYLFLGPYFCRMGILYLNYKRAIIGPPAKRHLNGLSLTCRCWPNIECWRGSFVIFRGSGQVLLRNPVFFQEGFRIPSPPLWIRASPSFLWHFGGFSLFWYLPLPSEQLSYRKFRILPASRGWALSMKNMVIEWKIGDIKS